MTEEEEELNRRCFEFAGAAVCGVCFGFILWIWNRSTDDVGPADYQDRISLVWYVLLTLGCYLDTFLILDRWLKLPFRNIRPNCVWIPLIATSLSLTVANISLLWHDRTSDLVELLYSFAGMLVIFNALMFVLMSLVWFVGFTTRFVSREIDNFRVTN